VADVPLGRPLQRCGADSIQLRRSTYLQDGRDRCGGNVNHLGYVIGAVRGHYGLGILFQRRTVGNIFTRNSLKSLRRVAFGVDFLSRLVVDRAGSFDCKTLTPFFDNAASIGGIRMRGSWFERRGLLTAAVMLMLVVSAIVLNLTYPQLLRGGAAGASNYDAQDGSH
jgi:hypothetical protein